ncbi:MAG: FAD-dependent oxidoreductase [Candidatus Babeliales bacterium]|nr:FAD-dependent oxidoreductase [Candidatus Babeliales bacterium]
MNKKNIKVAIIGGGASGLSTAWLLEKDYDVTLFEERDVLGGHARTQQIQIGDKLIPIDTGFEFFSPRMFVHFDALLKYLKVPLAEHPLTYTFHRLDKEDVLSLPPFHNGMVYWKSLTPKNISRMLQFLYFINRGKQVIESENLDITLEQFADSLYLTKSFKNEFLYPLLVAGWGQNINDFKKSSAYDILYWSVKNNFSAFKSLQWTEVVGGVKVYIDALAAQLTETKINLSSKVISLKPIENQYELILQNGEKQIFDYIIFSTSAGITADILQDVASSQYIRSKLSEIEYFKTTIAVHSDTSLMPKDKAYWSMANVRYDGVHSQLTIYKEWKSPEVPIFRSWVTYDKNLPKNLYAIEEYLHGKISPKTFTLKADIEKVQGNNNIWYAGVHTCGVDSHDTAILSAIKIAQKLAPDSERLKVFNL